MEKIPPSGSWVTASVAFACACLLGMLITGSASAVGFSAPLHLNAGTQPHSVVTNDFNGDGFADIAAANIFGDEVSVHLGDGVGGFGPASLFAVGQNPEAITSADYNGDGFADIASANITSDNVSVLLGDGSGNFTPATDFPTGDGPHYIASGDFNGDNRQDLITVDFYTSHISILLGDGSGGFGPPADFPLSPGSGPVSITTGDFDGDGKLDVATANFSSGDLTVLLGDGIGGLGPASSHAVDPSPQGIASGDFNEDGFADLATANYYSDTLSVLLGDGSGGFGPATAFGTGGGTSPNFAITADFDGDGHLDLVSANYNNDSISVLAGDGNGSFGTPAIFSTGAGTFPVSLATADFNGDGRPDLTSANFLPNYVSVLFNLDPRPDLQITKTADTPSAGPGDTVTYTLKVRNIGGAAADDASITDSLPVGTSFVSADAPCTESAGTVDCAVGSIAAGDEVTLELKVKVAVWAGSASTSDHLLDVQKQENQIDLDAGQQRTASVSCPSGYLATDGSVRIDHIDQGGGDWTSPEVLESRATSAGTWQGTVKNTATGRAQAKIFVVCVRTRTGDSNGHNHDLIATGEIAATDFVHAGHHEAVLRCGPGQVAIQPGFISSAPGDLVYSQPEGDGWKFGLDLHADSHVTFSIHCLTRQFGLAGGHTHDLGLQRIRTEVEVPAGKVNEVQLTCPDGSKGIVGGWDLDHGLLSIGNDPRPVTRAFRLYNPTAHPLRARLSLLCLGDMTGDELLGPADFVNTAYASTTSDDSDAANDLSSAAVAAGGGPSPVPIPEPPPVKPVVNNPIAGRIASRFSIYRPGGLVVKIGCPTRCAGKAKVTAAPRSRSGKRRSGKAVIIARGRYRLGGGISAVKLKVSRLGARLIDNGRLGRSAIVSISGGPSRSVHIKRP